MSDGKIRHIREIEQEMADYFRLSEADLAERVPSGGVTRHYDRTAWAATYLFQAALLIRPQRGQYRITENGRQVAASGDHIDLNYLQQFPEFQEFKQRTRGERSDDGSHVSIRPQSPVVMVDTPAETFGEGFQALQINLALEVLDRVRKVPPAFFEQLVLDLLVAMGYGGSRQEASRRVGRAGDDGVDGVINEDRLGLDVIYVQAKRWQGSVGPAIVREFSGSLELQGARKGVLITTGTFTKDAVETASRIQKKIVLIDGERLAQLMIDFNVGVAAKETFVIKRIDEDYFSGE